MDDMNYKPNSHKYKEEQKAANDEKRAEKVVQGKVKVKKKGEVRKFADVFVAEDAHNVKDYLRTRSLISLRMVLQCCSTVNLAQKRDDAPETMSHTEITRTGIVIETAEMFL